ncbi:hypothetical protein GGF31_005090 [Allomyces arbusculus]|nr:hypothetical protein GGF31_005090 [Allomyces arbusculus]
MAPVQSTAVLASATSESRTQSCSDDILPLDDPLIPLDDLLQPPNNDPLSPLDDGLLLPLDDPPRARPSSAPDSLPALPTSNAPTQVVECTADLVHADTTLPPPPRWPPSSLPAIGVTTAHVRRGRMALAHLADMGIDVRRHGTDPNVVLATLLADNDPPLAQLRAAYVVFRVARRRSTSMDPKILAQLAHALSTTSRLPWLARTMDVLTYLSQRHDGRDTDPSTFDGLALRVLGTLHAAVQRTDDTARAAVGDSRKCAPPSPVPDNPAPPTPSSRSPGAVRASRTTSALRRVLASRYLTDHARPQGMANRTPHLSALCLLLLADTPWPWHLARDCAQWYITGAARAGAQVPAAALNVLLRRARNAGPTDRPSDPAFVTHVLCTVPVRWFDDGTFAEIAQACIADPADVARVLLASDKPWVRDLVFITAALKLRGAAVPAATKPCDVTALTHVMEQLVTSERTSDDWPLADAVVASAVAAVNHDASRLPTRFLNAVMEGYLQSNQPDKAWHVLRTAVREPNRHTLNVLFRSLRGTRDVPRVLETAAKWTGHVLPDPMLAYWVVAAILRGDSGYAGDGAWTAAQGLLDALLHDAPETVPAVACNLLLQAYARGGQVTKAERWVQIMAEHDKTTPHSLVLIMAAYVTNVRRTVSGAASPRAQQVERRERAFVDVWRVWCALLRWKPGWTLEPAPPPPLPIKVRGAGRSASQVVPATIESSGEPSPSSLPSLFPDPPDRIVPRKLHGAVVDVIPAATHVLLVDHPPDPVLVTRTLAAMIKVMRGPAGALRPGQARLAFDLTHYLELVRLVGKLHVRVGMDEGDARAAIARIVREAHWQYAAHTRWPVWIAQVERLARGRGLAGAAAAAVEGEVGDEGGDGVPVVEWLHARVAAMAAASADSAATAVAAGAATAKPSTK